MATFSRRLMALVALSLFILITCGGVAHVLSVLSLTAPEDVWWHALFFGLAFAVLVAISPVLFGRRRWHRLKWGWVLVPILGLGLLVATLQWLRWAWCGTPLGCTEAPPSAVVAPQVSFWGSLPLQMLFYIIGAVLIVLIPKYLHLLRVYVETIFLIGGSVRTMFRKPLPSQRNVIEGLQKASVGRQAPAPNVVSLRGNWGAGKTACMSQFEFDVSPENQKNKKRDCAVTVWFDCWRHQADPSPEMSLYWEAANKYFLLWPFGWLSIPVMRLYLSRLPLVLKADLKVGGSFSLMLEGQPFREVPKALFWRQHLEMLVSGALRGGYGRVVLVLEDIDRCMPYAAQVFVTLVRRFLSVPGVTVILPYVREQMAAKVFNPLSYQLPDLAGTTHAVLWSQYTGQKKLDEVFDQIQSRLLGDGKFGQSQNGSPGDGKPVGQGKGDEKSHSDMGRLPEEVVRAWMWSEMARQYAATDRASRTRVDMLLADKYLSDTVQEVPYLSMEDCVALALDRLEDHAVLRALILMATDLNEALVRRLENLEEVRALRVEARQFNCAFEQILLCLDEPRLRSLLDAFPKSELQENETGEWQVLLTLLVLALKYADARVVRSRDGSFL